MRQIVKTNFRDAIGKSMKEQKEGKKSYGYLDLPKDIKVLSIKEETKHIDLDFLPYVVSDPKHPEAKSGAVPGALWFRRPFKVHRNIGSDNETVVCPRSFGKSCPICDEQKRLYDAKASKDETKVLYPSPRSLYVVIPLDVDGYDEEPTIFNMSDKLFLDELNDHCEEHEEDLCFPDLENGKTATLDLKWKELGDNKYPEVKNITFTKRAPYKEEILDIVPDLDEVLVVLPYEELKAMFFQLDAEEKGDDIIDDTHEERKRKSVSSYREAPEKEVEKEPEETKQSARNFRTGVEKEKEKEPEKEEKRPVVHRQRTVDKAKEKPTNECPFGHTFAYDVAEFPKDCDNCDKWDACDEANTHLTSEQKKTYEKNKK